MRCSAVVENGCPDIENSRRNFDENLSLSLIEMERALAFHLKMESLQ